MNEDKNNNNQDTTNEPADIEQSETNHVDSEQVSSGELSAAVQQPMPGEILRKAREAAGMSTQQVAERLRLRLKLIEGIEANNFGDNMEGTFTRGYLKAYARLVQVPEQDVLDAYNSMGVTEKPIEQMQSFSRKTALEKDDSKLMVLTWVIVLIIIGSVAFFAWQKFQEDVVANGNGASAYTEEPATEALPHERSEPQHEEEPVSRDAVSEPIDDTLPDAEDLREAMTDEVVVSDPEQNLADDAPIDETPTDLADLTEPEPESEQDPVEEPVTESESAQPEDTATDVTDTQTSAFDPGMADLVFVFNNDVWIRIEDATGEAIAYGVKNAGYVMPLDGVAPYQATIGAPQHVDVYFRGEAVDLSHIRSGRVANIQIPQANENE